MLQNLLQILFYGLMALFAVYSFLMIYVLLRFGRSKILALTLSALYVFALLILYGAAQYYFGQINLALLT